MKWMAVTGEGVGMFEAPDEATATQLLVENGHYEFDLYTKTGSYRRKVEVELVQEEGEAK